MRRRLNAARRNPPRRREPSVLRFPHALTARQAAEIREQWMAGARTVPMDVRPAEYDRIERDYPPKWWNRGGSAVAMTLLHDWRGRFRR